MHPLTHHALFGAHVSNSRCQGSNDLWTSAGFTAERRIAACSRIKLATQRVRVLTCAIEHDFRNSGRRSPSRVERRSWGAGGCRRLSRRPCDCSGTADPRSVEILLPQHPRPTAHGLAHAQCPRQDDVNEACLHPSNSSALAVAAARVGQRGCVGSSGAMKLIEGIASATLRAAAGRHISTCALCSFSRCAERTGT